MRPMHWNALEITMDRAYRTYRRMQTREDVLLDRKRSHESLRATPRKSLCHAFGKKRWKNTWVRHVVFMYLFTPLPLQLVTYSCPQTHRQVIIVISSPPKPASEIAAEPWLSFESRESSCFAAPEVVLPSTCRLLCISQLQPRSLSRCHCRSAPGL